MIKISIVGRKYRIPTCWEDITLAQCAWLQSKVKELSPELRAYYHAHTSNEGAKELTNTIELLAFSSEALAYLAAIPKRCIQHTSTTDLLAIASGILPRFVCGVMGHVDYVPVGRVFFRHHYRRYMYPETGADVMGVHTPLSRISAVELCQLSDIVRSDNMALASLAVAICCRPGAERYDEAKAQQRAACFSSLPASVYWELWWLVSETHKYLRSNFPECYGKNDDSSGQRAGKAVLWSNQLVAMGVGNPASLSGLQNMNGYDFVHLMNEHIKHKTEEWKMNAALSGLRVI